MKFNKNFKSWVNTLLDEGYNLSDYSWDELYETYLTEADSRRGNGPVRLYNKPLAPYAGTPAPGAGDYHSKYERPKNAGTGYTERGQAIVPGGRFRPQISNLRPSDRQLNQYPPGTPTGASRPNRQPPASPPPNRQPPATGGSSSSGGRSIPRPAAVPAPRSTSGATTPAAKPSNFSPANLPTSEKIKSGMQVYNAQRAAGDMKAAASTGMGINQMKYGENFAKPKTPNPLMQKTFGYQTGESPRDKPSSTTSASPAATPIPKIKPDSGNIIKLNSPDGSGSTVRIPGIPRTKKESYDFGKPNRVARDIQSLYQSIYEGKKVDQDLDGDNDGADVMIARMVASGMSRVEAIRRTRKKSYNKESYDLESLAVLTLMNEGYAKDLISAQAIYENASLKFKEELYEFAAVLARMAPALLRASTAAAEGGAAAGEGAAGSMGSRLLGLGKKALKARLLNKNKSDEKDSSEQSSSNENPLRSYLNSIQGI